MEKLKRIIVSVMIFSLLAGSIGIFLMDSNVAYDNAVALENVCTTNHEPKPLGM